MKFHNLLSQVEFKPSNLNKSSNFLQSGTVYIKYGIFVDAKPIVNIHYVKNTYILIELKCRGILSLGKEYSEVR